MKVNLPLPYLGKDFLCEITLALLEFFLCPCVGDMPSGRLWGSWAQTTPPQRMLMKSASESAPRWLHSQQS